MAPEIPILNIPPTAPHTHTVVFLHGRGDNAQNFAASLSHSLTTTSLTLPEALPSVRWVFPQAPLRPCASSSDVPRQWFDVWNVRDFAQNEELQAEGLREVVPVLRGVLAEEVALLGGRWEGVVLAGISMGAATSVHLMFNLDAPRLGAFLGFSCRCPFSGRDLKGMREVLGLEEVPAHDDVLRNTPMLLEHCANDPLVLVENGRRLRDTLQGFGAAVEWKEYPSGGHWFNSPTGMDDAVEFLKRNVAGLGSPDASSQVSTGPMDML